MGQIIIASIIAPILFYLGYYTRRLEEKPKKRSHIDTVLNTHYRGHIWLTRK